MITGFNLFIINIYYLLEYMRKNKIYN